MKKYFRVYTSLLLFNWNALITYRSSFFTRIFSSMLYTTYHVVSILILTNTISSVFGWTRNELLLLASTYSVFIGLFHAFISRNMQRLTEEIYLGKLDYLLVKPIDSQFSGSLWTVDFISFFRVGMGLLLTWYFIDILHLTITAQIVFFYIILMLVGICILYSIWLSVVSITIFNPRLSNVVDLLYHMSEFTRYPREMFQHVSVFLFSLLIPFTFILIPPTKILLNTFSVFQGFEAVLIGITLFFISRLIWMQSLKHYTSASS